MTKETAATDVLEAFRNQFLAWRHNRNLYPGWLIAPYQTRASVWARTRYWIERIPELREEWREHEILLMLNEVCWRSNLCLQILPDSFLDFTSDILLQLIEDVQKPKYEKYPTDMIYQGVKLTIESAELTEAWIYCALDIIRHARVKGQRDIFKSWVSHVEAVAGLSDDVRSAILYEKCLFDLAEAKIEGAHLLVEDWPNNPKDIYWFVRKAGILLELGEISSAKSLIEQTLIELRAIEATEEGGITKYWVYSREGWCVNFLQNIEYSSGYKFSRIHSDREKELEAYRCSPSVEIDRIRTNLEGRPAPLKQKRISQNSPDFDDGYRQEIRHYGSDESNTRLSAAISTIKLIEHSGMPPVIENLGTSRLDIFIDTFQQSLEWIVNDFSDLWASLVMRFKGIGLGKENISRTTLEALSQAQVENLFSTISVKIDEELGTSTDKENQKQKELPKYWLEFASRLSLRLTNKQRLWMLETAIRIAELERKIFIPNGREIRQNLLNRSIPYLTAKEIQEELSSLLNFPLQGELSHDHSNFFFEDPFNQIPDRIIKQLNRPKEKEFSKLISKTLEKAKSTNKTLRSYGIIRLCRLWSTGLMREKEREKFAKAIWSKVDEFGLPVLTDDIFKSILLELPEVEIGQSKTALLKWIKKASIPSRFSNKPMSGSNSSENRLHLDGRDDDLLLSTIINIAAQNERLDESKSLNFSVSTKLLLIRKILDWWQHDRQAYADWLKKPHFWHAPFDRTDKVFKALIMFLVDRESLDKKIVDELSFMIAEIETVGVRMDLSIPLQASFNPDQTERLLAQLSQGLLSLDASQAHRYAISTWYWQRRHRQLSIQPLSGEIRITIFNLVGGLSLPAAKTLLFVISDLLRTQQLILNEPEKLLLKNSVEAASTILSYEYEEFAAASDIIDRDEVPHYRKNLAKLISSMSIAGLPLGQIARSWLDDVKLDPCVDVRYAAKINDI